MTPLYLKARAEARLETALREYREARRDWYSFHGEIGGTRRRVRALCYRARWSTLHDLLHTPEPTWAEINGDAPVDDSLGAGAAVEAYRG